MLFVSILNDTYIFYSLEQQRLPDESILILDRWLRSNVAHPRPTRDEKRQLALEANLTTQQVGKWFSNARRALRKDKYNKRSNRLTIANRNILKTFFKTNSFPTAKDIYSLHELTRMQEKKLHTWFAKERFKNKRKAAEDKKQ